MPNFDKDFNEKAKECHARYKTATKEELQKHVDPSSMFWKQYCIDRIILIDIHLKDDLSVDMRNHLLNLRKEITERPEEFIYRESGGAVMVRGKVNFVKNSKIKKDNVRYTGRLMKFFDLKTLEGFNN